MSGPPPSPRARLLPTSMRKGCSIYSRNERPNSSNLGVQSRRRRGVPLRIFRGRGGWGRQSSSWGYKRLCNESNMQRQSKRKDNRRGGISRLRERRWGSTKKYIRIIVLRSARIAPNSEETTLTTIPELCQAQKVIYLQAVSTVQQWAVQAAYPSTKDW